MPSQTVLRRGTGWWLSEASFLEVASVQLEPDLFGFREQCVEAAGERTWRQADALRHGRDGGGDRSCGHLAVPANSVAFPQTLR